MKAATTLAFCGALIAGSLLVPIPASAEDGDRGGYVGERDVDRFGWEQYQRGYRQGRADLEREGRVDRDRRRRGGEGWVESDESYGRRGLSLLRGEREMEGGYGRRSFYERED